MTVYAPTGTTGINIPTEQGGCGNAHQADGLAPGEHMAVTCPQCEPVILAMRGHGWASDPMQVALTPDERRAAEAAASKAQLEQQKTWSSPHAFAAFMQAAGFNGGDAGMNAMDAQRAMMQQMAALQEQVNQLTAQLAAKTGDAQAALTDPAASDVPAAPATAAAPAKAAKKTTTAAKKATPGAPATPTDTPPADDPTPPAA